MRKLLAVFMSLMMLALVACDATTNSSNFVFEANGTKIELGAKADDIIASLGEPVNYHESESCAFKGLDKEYTYPGFVITTYPKDDVDYIYTITITDDTVSTPEGLAIGSTTADVEVAYGVADESTDAMTSYKDANGNELQIGFSGEMVSSIIYFANVDIQ